MQVEEDGGREEGKGGGRGREASVAIITTHSDSTCSTLFFFQEKEREGKRGIGEEGITEGRGKKRKEKKRKEMKRKEKTFS